MIQLLRLTNELKRTMLLIVDDNGLLGSKKMPIFHFKLFFLLEDLIVADFSSHIATDFVTFFVIFNLQFQLGNRSGLLFSLQ